MSASGRGKKGIVKIDKEKEETTKDSQTSAGERQRQIGNVKQKRWERKKKKQSKESVLKETNNWKCETGKLRKKEEKTKQSALKETNKEFWVWMS